MILRLTIGLLCLLGVAACTQPGATPSGTQFISAAQSDALRARHVDTVNTLRADNGVGPVRISAELIAAAQTHARDMSVQERAWHFGSDGTSPKDRARRAGYPGRVLGENISESFDGEFALFQSWATSGQTRQIMLDPSATDIGLGWFQEPNGKLWWVQLLGARDRGAIMPIS